MPSSVPTRIGLIGCGGIVQKTHLACLLRLPQARIVAVADPMPAARNTVADAAAVPADRRFDDFAPLLAAGDVDLVLIATPHHLHVPAIAAAIRHRVGIVCEKPILPELASARELAAELTQSDVPFTVVHNFLFSPGNVRAHELLRENGGAGEKRCFARAQSLFAKEAPLNPRDWRNQLETGGGALNDTCYHEIYQIESLVGAPIASVQARVSTVYHPISADDLVLLTLEHANGILSTVTTAWSLPGYEGSYCELHTNRRTLRVEGRGRRLRVYDRATRAWREEPLNASDAAGIASGHFGFWDETLRAFRAGRPLPIPPSHALRQVELLEAARQSSADHGRPVEVNRVSVPLASPLSFS